MIKTRLAVLSVSLLWGVSAQAADTSVQFLLKGKPVQSVPLDQLGEVQIVVNSGGPSFKQLWTGQWQGLDQSLNVVAMPYKKGGAAPSFENSHQWKGYSLSRTNYDANWANQKSLTGQMAKAAMVDGLALFDATSEEDLIFTTRFRRQVYTGKVIYKEGGYVKETRWETAGPHRGSGSLKLLPPTFASSLNPESIFSAAVANLNSPPENEYDLNRAMFVSRNLLYPTSYGGREVHFKGSKALGFSTVPGAKPVFNWNYLDSDGSHWIYAKFPVKLQVQSVMTTKMDNLPVPTKLEAVFDCPLTLSVKRKIGTSQWQASDIEFNEKTLTGCRTPEGKTPKEVAALPGTPLMVDDTKSPTDQAKDLLDGLKGLAF